MGTKKMSGINQYCGQKPDVKSNPEKIIYIYQNSGQAHILQICHIHMKPRIHKRWHKQEYHNQTEVCPLVTI